MKVKDLIKHLEELPQDLDVIYSKDTEGNAFDKIFFESTLVKFNEAERAVESFDCKEDANAVCIN